MSGTGDPRGRTDGPRTPNRPGGPHGPGRPGGRGPHFTPEQVRRRQLIALATLLVLLLLLGSCLVSAIRALTSGGAADGALDAPVARGDDTVMTVAATPADAPAHDQLLKDITLAPDESIGIDVSAHQQQIDWVQVAGDGYTFAYIKATEGSGHADPQFTANWTGAKEAGLTVGAYHYFTLCSPGADQAADFLATVPPDDTALPPALDLEFDGACDDRPEAERAQAEIDDFVEAVEEEWGRRLVIYSSSEWRSHYGLPVAEGRPGWLYSDTGRPADDEWAVWQLHFTGTVSGIRGDVDIDVVRVEVPREKAKIEQE